MLIGLTYDLKQDYTALGYSAEDVGDLDSEETINAINQALQELGHQTEKIGGIKNLTTLLAAGKRWDLVFNICEGFFGHNSRESQVPALLDAYQIPYTFSDSLTLGVSLRKDWAKKLAKKYRITTPEFFVVHSIDELKKLVATYKLDLPKNSKINYPLFAKPVAEGTSKGIGATSKITNTTQLYEVCEQLLNQFKQPILVENYCQGREFTAAILGTGKNAKYLGALEIIFLPQAEQHAYTFDNKQFYHERIRYELVTDKKINQLLQRKTKALWQAFEGKDVGRIDYIIDDATNKINFIEINPIPGLNPISSDLCILCNKLGITHQALISKIIDSAMKRYNCIVQTPYRASPRA